MKVLKSVGLFLLLLVGFRLFVGETCLVTTHSMVPTLQPTELLFYNKAEYGAVLPRRWSDIPVVNIFTWVRAWRNADAKTDWGYRRMPGIRKPKAGEVVVFESPEEADVMLVKRIHHIVQKGTEIPYDKGNSPLIEELAAKDGHKVRQDVTTLFIDDSPMLSYTTEQTYFYAVGDNRRNSRDSDEFGYVEEKRIIGRMCMRLFSIGEEGIRWRRLLNVL